MADFIGNPKVNLLDGEIYAKDLVDVGDFNIKVHTHKASGKVVVGIRPENIVILSRPEKGAIEFTAYSVLPSGADSTMIAHRGNVELIIRVMGIRKIKMDEKIWLTFDPSCLNLYRKDSGELITA